MASESSRVEFEQTQEMRARLWRHVITQGRARRIRRGMVGVATAMLLPPGLVFMAVGEWRAFWAGFALGLILVILIWWFIRRTHHATADTFLNDQELRKLFVEISPSELEHGSEHGWTRELWSEVTLVETSDEDVFIEFAHSTALHVPASAFRSVDAMLEYADLAMRWRAQAALAQGDVKLTPVGCENVEGAVSVRFYPTSQADPPGNPIKTPEGSHERATS